MASAKSKRSGRRSVPEVRKGQAKWPLTRTEFTRRFNERFHDPAFAAARPEIERIREIAADAYFESRKSPRRRKAGKGFAVPGYELPIEWLQTRPASGQLSASSVAAVPDRGSC